MESYNVVSMLWARAITAGQSYRCRQIGHIPSWNVLIWIKVNEKLVWAAILDRVAGGSDVRARLPSGDGDEGIPGYRAKRPIWGARIQAVAPDLQLTPPARPRP